MASNLPVKLGFWTDHNWSEAVDNTTFLLTVSAPWGSAWKISIGVALGLGWPCARIILVRSCAWSYQLIPPNPWSPIPETKTTGGLHPTMPRTQSKLGLFFNTERVTSRTVWPEVVMASLIGVMAVLYGFAGGAVGEMPTSNTVLSNSADCGFWELQRNVDSRIQDKDDLIQAEKEMRASQYAKNCYGEQPIHYTAQCEPFQAREIAHSMEKVNCPFPCPDPNNCICANGIYDSAVKFDTSTFHVDRLGVNAAHLPLVRRTSTFVPLDINYGFVVDKSGSGNDFDFEYYLGAINDTAGFRNFTFSMQGLPFNWGIAAYAVSAYESTPSGSEYDAWLPIPDLSRARDTYMTVIFVSSCRIFYNGRCEDPVFPADRDVFPIGRPSRKYYNSDPRPRVLVAIDEMRICAKDNKICDSPDELPKGISLELRSAYDMARTIFKRTSTYNSLRYRLGSALLAADGISDFESRQLSNEQWIIESQALFRTSLARLQFNTMDFAMGDRPRVLHEKAYNNTTPDWARHENCTPYKFSLPGQYSNIQVAQFGFLLIPIALFIGSRKVGLPSQDLPFPGSWIFFDSVVYHILFVASLIGRGLWYVVLVTKRKIQEIGRLY
ncbi:hypothetical protein PG989_016566 [Apiospora arundinis]